MDEIKTGQPTQDFPPKPLISTSTNNTQMSQILVNEPIQQDTFGRVSLAKGGFVDVIDEDTLEIAKSYLKVLEKKIINLRLTSVSFSKTSGLPPVVSTPDITI
jgi:hypothetical protein